MTQFKFAILFQLLLARSVLAFSPSIGHGPTLRTATQTQTTQTQLQATTGNKEINRRDALASSFAAILTAGTGTIALTLAPEPASAQQGMPLFAKVEKLETANYIGQVNKPVYRPNVSGEPEIHTPKVKVNGNDVEVYADHAQSEDNYIQFLWLKDTKTNEVVLAKELTPADERPSLKARVPSGVELTPYAFCKMHGLWIGEPFKVA